MHQKKELANANVQSTSQRQSKPKNKLQAPKSQTEMRSATNVRFEQRADGTIALRHFALQRPVSLLQNILSTPKQHISNHTFQIHTFQIKLFKIAHFKPMSQQFKSLSDIKLFQIKVIPQLQIKFLFSSFRHFTCTIAFSML